MEVESTTCERKRKRDASRECETTPAEFSDDACERPVFSVTKVVLSKTGIGYFARQEQSKFRDFFTKGLNETRAGLVAKKEQKSLEGKRDRSVTRITAIVSDVRFAKLSASV